MCRRRRRQVQRHWRQAAATAVGRRQRNNQTVNTATAPASSQPPHPGSRSGRGTAPRPPGVDGQRERGWDVVGVDCCSGQTITETATTCRSLERAVSLQAPAQHILPQPTTVSPNQRTLMDRPVPGQRVESSVNQRSPGVDNADMPASRLPGAASAAMLLAGPLLLWSSAGGKRLQCKRAGSGGEEGGRAAAAMQRHAWRRGASRRLPPVSMVLQPQVQAQRAAERCMRLRLWPACHPAAQSSSVGHW